MSEPDYQELLTRVERLQLAIWFMIDSFEAAVTAHDRRYQGGQQIPYHGEFASITPSVVTVLKRYARSLRNTLRGEWPMTRSEYVSAYPELSKPDVGQIFMERQP